MSRSKHNSKAIRPIVLALLVICLTIILGACGPTVEKGKKPSENWSRSINLGDTIGSVGMVVDSTDHTTHMVWPSDGQDGIFLQYLKLDSNAEIIEQQELNFPGSLRFPGLIIGEDGNLHLLWSSRSSAKEGWALWYTQLSNAGSTTMTPVRLSALETSVVNYSLASDRHGGLLAVWEQDARGEMVLVRIDSAGRIIAGPYAFPNPGSSPTMQVDADDQIHLAWLEGSTFYYSQLPLTDPKPGDGIPVTDVVYGSGNSLFGPELGLSEGWVYLVWSILNQTGMEAGTAKTEFISFPFGAARRINGKPINITPDEEQPAEDYDGSYNLLQLSPGAENAWESSSFILHPNANDAIPEGDLVVALAAQQLLRLDQHLQIVAAVFRRGDFIGYSYGSKTEGISDAPVIVSDDAGDIYLAWREGYGGRSIYFAATAAPFMVTLDRLESGDYIGAVLQGSIEGLVSIALTPVIGFGWMLPGLLVLGLWKLIRENESLTDWASWIPLIIAIALYEFIKFITLPTIFTYVPFSAWLAIPLWLEPILKFGMPVLIFLISVGVAVWVQVRVRRSTILFYVAFTITDALITLGIYGVNFLGVF
jgi:hypothetical protein